MLSRATEAVVETRAILTFLPLAVPMGPNAAVKPEFLIRELGRSPGSFGVVVRLDPRVEERSLRGLLAQVGA